MPGRRRTFHPGSVSAWLNPNPHRRSARGAGPQVRIRRCPWSGWDMRWSVSPVYREGHTGRQHPAALICHMTYSEPARAPARTRSTVLAAIVVAVAVIVAVVASRIDFRQNDTKSPVVGIDLDRLGPGSPLGEADGVVP